MSDTDDEVAIEGEIEPESPTGDVDDGNEDEAAIDLGPGGPSGTVHQRGRSISEKTRELFRSAAKRIAEQNAAGSSEFGDYDEGYTPPLTVTPATAETRGSTPIGPGTTATAPAAPAPSLDPGIQQAKERLDHRQTELAHHVVLYRRLPGANRDWQSIAKALMDWTIGRSLHHELRVIALQYVVQKKLGWRPSADRLVSLSWPGLQDVANAALDNRAVFAGRPADDLSRTAAARHVRRLHSEVSGRHVTMYANAVRELRGEA